MEEVEVNWLKMHWHDRTFISLVEPIDTAADQNDDEIDFNFKKPIFGVKCSKKRHWRLSALTINAQTHVNKCDM